MDSEAAGPACWVFKIVDNPKYPDQHGRAYVYDSSHSVRVKPGDHFVYLKKSARNDLAFTGCGVIEQVDVQDPDRDRVGRKRRIFTARLAEFAEFETPVVISPRKAGDDNRNVIGFSRNLNDDGLSRSVCRIRGDQFESIRSLASAAELRSEVESVKV